MTLQEFYAKLGSDYQSMFKQIPNEQMIRKFLLLYPSDSSVQLLHQSISRQDWNEAFRAVHTLKGVALNLGLPPLAAAASALTEALRGGKPLTDPSLLECVDTQHQALLAALSELE